MENIEVMVVLFIIVVLGYAMCKLGYMGDKFDQKLSSIVIDITCPALILSSVMGTELPDRSLILPLLGVGFLTYILLLVFGFWVPRFISKNHDDQGMIGFTLMFANVGFIGYPIVSSIFGPKAIWRFSPAIIAAFIAAILVACGVHTPDIIARPITIVGNITVPAALMIIGSSMARLPLREIVGSPKVYVTSFLRLIVVPLSVYYLFKVCGVSNIVNNINTVVIAMPVASFGTMFCMKYGRNPSLITEITFITTVGSILTIPLITMLF